MKAYSIPLSQGKSGSVDVVQTLIDHGLEFEHIRYRRNALEESSRTGNDRLTKILRQMKIKSDSTGIDYVIYHV